jgi:hypothetical protein
MRPSNPHDPEYGLLPIYAPGLAEVKAAFKRHMRLRRLPTWALFSSIYATVASGMKAATALDDKLHPGWRDQPIREPVFIIGNARSGTTMLHRLMTIDEETFSGMKLYQSSLNNVSVQRGLQALGRLDDKLPLHPMQAAIDQVNALMFTGWDGIHKLGIDQHEEDEATWALGMTSITVNLLVPYTEELNSMRFFDRMDPEFRARFMDFYEASIKRHLFATAPDKRFINKNVFFTPRVRSVVERMPDARFLYLVRDPAEALPSFLSMWWEKWVSHTPEIQKDGPEAKQLVQLAYDYYDYALGLLDELGPNQILVVRYDELTQDPDEEVHRIYDWLGIEMSPAFKQNLYDFTHAQRCYESAHEYTLEDFGLTRDEVYTGAKRFCERFGFKA